MEKKYSEDSTEVLMSFSELVEDDTNFGQWANNNRDKLHPLNCHFINNLIDGKPRYSKENSN